MAANALNISEEHLSERWNCEENKTEFCQFLLDPLSPNLEDNMKLLIFSEKEAATSGEAATTNYKTRETVFQNTRYVKVVDEVRGKILSENNLLKKVRTDKHRDGSAPIDEDDESEAQGGEETEGNPSQKRSNESEVNNRNLSQIADSEVARFPYAENKLLCAPEIHWGKSERVGVKYIDGVKQRVNVKELHSIVGVLPDIGAVGVIGQLVTETGRKTLMKAAALRMTVSKSTYNGMVEILTETNGLMEHVELVLVQLTGLELKTMKHGGVKMFSTEQEVKIRDDETANCLVIGANYYNTLDIKTFGLGNNNIKTIVINPNGKHVYRKRYQTVDWNIIQQCKDRGLSLYCEDFREWMLRLNAGAGRNDTRVYMFEDFENTQFELLRAVTTAWASDSDQTKLRKILRELQKRSNDHNWPLGDFRMAGLRDEICGVWKFAIEEEKRIKTSSGISGNSSGDTERFLQASTGSVNEDILRTSTDSETGRKPQMSSSSARSTPGTSPGTSPATPPTSPCGGYHCNACYQILGDSSELFRNEKCLKKHCVEDHPELFPRECEDVDETRGQTCGWCWQHFNYQNVEGSKKNLADHLVKVHCRLDNIKDRLGKYLEKAKTNKKKGPTATSTPILKKGKVLRKKFDRSTAKIVEVETSDEKTPDRKEEKDPEKFKRYHWTRKKGDPEKTKSWEEISYMGLEDTEDGILLEDKRDDSLLLDEEQRKEDEAEKERKIILQREITENEELLKALQGCGLKLAVEGDVDDDFTIPDEKYNQMLLDRIGEIREGEEKLNREKRENLKKRPRGPYSRESGSPELRSKKRKKIPEEENDDEVRIPKTVKEEEDEGVKVTENEKKDQENGDAASTIEEIKIKKEKPEEIILSSDDEDEGFGAGRRVREISPGRKIKEENPPDVGLQLGNQVMAPTMENMATLAALVCERMIESRRPPVQYQPFAIQDELLLDAPEEIVRTVRNDRVQMEPSDDMEERANESLDYEPDDEFTDVNLNRFLVIMLRCLIILFRPNDTAWGCRSQEDVFQHNVNILGIEHYVRLSPMVH